MTPREQAEQIAEEQLKTWPTDAPFGILRTAIRDDLMIPAIERALGMGTDIPKVPVRAHDLSRQGGGWLGAARSWLQHRRTTKGVHGDQITWGDPNARFELGADSVEELAAEVAAAAFNEQGDLKDAIGKLRGKHLRLEIEHRALVEELAAAKRELEAVRRKAQAHEERRDEDVACERLRASNAEANCERLGRELETAERANDINKEIAVTERQRADAAEKRVQRLDEAFRMMRREALVHECGPSLSTCLVCNIISDADELVAPAIPATAKRCIRRCDLNGRQCVCDDGHAGAHFSEGCSWFDDHCLPDDNLDSHSKESK